MTYFNILNNFAIYVILGVAADDFFIFMDAWNQSEAFHDIKFDNEKRMAYTMRRASRTMFMTSCTTAVAFLATCFSPIMPIQAFGIYSAILVPMNFLLTCYFLPPCVILYEKTCKNNCFFIINAQSVWTDNYHENDDSFQYLRFPIADNDCVPFGCYKPDGALRFMNVLIYSIEEVIASGSSFFIHCIA